MRQALVDLISRMTALEPPVNSGDSISWRAHREAEERSDPTMIDELADYLQHEPNKERRRAAYFILGKLGQKFRSADCASVLISHVPNEADKYVLSDLLHALSGVRKPGNLDLTPVFDLLQDERWLVRHSAIQALKQTDSAEAEFQLLRHLDTTNNPYDITYCQSTLNEIGSEKAIPYLEKNLRSRIRDVKMSAQFAIEAIQARRKM